MKLAVLANDEQWKEINAGDGTVNYIRISSPLAIPPGIGACLFLQEDMEYDFTAIPGHIFLNAVCTTLKEMDAPANVLRINGWNGFLSRNIWEVAGPVTDNVLQVFAAMGKQMVAVPDEPGLISARVIAMIINEAYFALEDNISTPEEIDIAMKLGTNYPYGPFEWASLIGIEKICALLQKLSLTDRGHLPAPLLKSAARF